MVVIRWAALYGCTKPDGPHDRRDAGQRGSAPMQERQARTGRRSVEREWGGRRENIMQRTGLRLSQLGGLEGWKAGRLKGFSKGTTRAFGRCEWRPVEDTEGREANEDPAERSLGFWGDGSIH